MKTLTTPGLYFDFPAAAYHADPCPEPSLSSSVGRLLLNRSPAHARLAHPRLNPEWEERKPSAAMAVGAAAHDVALLDDWSRIEFVDADSWRTKAARVARDDAILEGRVPMLEGQRQQVEDIVSALLGLGWLPDDRRTEVVAVWQEGEGIWCRSRMDCLVQRSGLDRITDFKTTATGATPDDWGRRLVWDYALQCGLYRRGYAALHEGRLPNWQFVVQEVAPPYAVAVFEYDEEALLHCDALADHAVEAWRECITTGEWPAYPPTINTVTLPNWLRQWDDEIEV